MKKLIIAIAALGLILTGCSSNENENENKVNEYFNYVTIVKDNGEEIFYDKNTKIMYYKSYRYNDNDKGGITPIYNADGSLRLYEEE